jgi:hypothetical protein
METRELKQELALAMACPSECGIGCLGWWRFGPGIGCPRETQFWPSREGLTFSVF